MVKIEPFEISISEYEDWFEKSHFVYVSELQVTKIAIIKKQARY